MDAPPLFPLNLRIRTAALVQRLLAGGYMHPVKFSWWGAMLLTGLAAIVTAVSCTAVPSWMINDQPSLATQYALAKVSPAVVRIDVVTQDYEDAVPVSYRAIGSGVIIDAQGHILTNFHVAGRADRIDI